MKVQCFMQPRKNWGPRGGVQTKKGKTRRPSKQEKAGGKRSASGKSSDSATVRVNRGPKGEVHGLGPELKARRQRTGKKGSPLGKRGGATEKNWLTLEYHFSGRLREGR